MKKWVIAVIILSLILINALGYISLQKNLVGTHLPVECNENKDCKLIYSNCNCESVPITDSRTILESDKICEQNSCISFDVTAVCINHYCNHTKWQ